MKIRLPVFAQLLAGIRTQELLTYLPDFPHDSIVQCLIKLSFSITAARQFRIHTGFPFQPSILPDSTSLKRILLSD
ncbi:Hypothetical protein VV1_1172 [Vibrio vulnificus CMCP6]|uniref:Uncharacterized protein n=1 Tax=Vibrio vulnificus (strain CMCP6) TaxID=216895 RepID=A0A3Q0L3C4_VIBVU|nr:Hypothetical protein VV1_1172 [Vibrio vulnificus CMCP6]